MKSIKFFILFIFLSLNCIASLTGKTVNGNGNVVKKEVSIGSYTKIEAGSSVKIFYRQDALASQSLILELDENLWDLVEIKAAGETLEIKAKNNTSINPSRFIVYTNSKLLESIDLSGACKVMIDDKLEGDKLDVEASGASKLSINQCVVNDVDVDCSGASDVTLTIVNANNAELKTSGASKVQIAELSVKTKSEINISGSAKVAINSGKSTSLELSVSGAGKLNAKEWFVSTAEVELSGSGKADIAVSETLSINASGVSQLNYNGAPRIIHQSLSGSSKVLGR